MTNYPSIPASGRRKFRPEIQGLRAIAVVAVLLFHVWPAAVPGGFVGVDVFFVISGYLITKHLVDEQIMKGRIDFVDFYSRRIRRLLPAATLVLVAIAFGSVLFLPATVWQDTAWHIFASAFYGENWYLAWQATDYLAAENRPTPTQHYWSLSIEEQFYFVWPILIVAAGAVAVSLRQPARWIIFAALAMIFATSLGASIIITQTNPAQAYFVSHTRIWELALGGLLAIAKLRAPDGMKAPMGWIGFGMILAACLLYNKLTPFPSYTALLPTVGTALMLLSEDSGNRKWGVYTMLTPNPVQYLGDISYSLYLWHWPIIIFFTARTGLDADLMNGIGLIAVAIVLSHLTKRFVEDPYRKSKPRPSERAPLLTPIGFLGWTSVVSILGAGLVYFSGNSGSPLDDQPLENASYPGVEAVYSNIATAPDLSIRPELTQVMRDVPKSYRGGAHRCHMGFDAAVPPIMCIYGNPEGERTIYLVGDSHALNWAPAFDTYGKTNNITIKVFTKSGCPVLTSSTRSRGASYESCLEWGRAVLDTLSREKAELIVIGQSAGAILFEEGKTMEAALSNTWQPLVEKGIKLVVIADTSRFTKENPSTCYARTRDISICATALSDVLRPDPLSDWGKSANVPILDLNDGVCPNETCVPVIGNILVWRDGHHLTATFSRTFGPEISRRLEDIY